MESSISDWAVLSSLDSKFLTDVKTIATFNDSFGQYAIFIKQNGDLYSIGKSNLGCLGLDDLTYTEVPVKIEHISEVADVKLGPSTVFAYTLQDKFYIWGGTRSERPEEGRTWPKNIKIKQLATGECSHIIVLTDEGKLHEWKSTWALPHWRDSFNTTKPTLHALRDVNIVQVACGYNESLALADNGDVYFWGWRGKSGSTEPAAIVTQLKGKKCIKVACGSLHCLVLTEAGELYTWGLTNSCGELGNGTITPSRTPFQLAADIGKFIDITTNGFHTSAAIREDGAIYMWGLGGNGLAQLSPILTDCKELHQVFAKCDRSTFVWNYQPVNTDPTHLTVT